MVLSKSPEFYEDDEVEELNLTSSDLFNPEGPDSDMSDSSALASNVILNNPRLTSLFASPRGWRMLRLPGARGNERGDLLNFMTGMLPGWKGQTIRDSPLTAMITSRMWQDYINNMEPNDDAMELQAPYSPEEELSLQLFCQEWVNDPGHTAFSRRLIAHPSVSQSSAMQKGNLIYSLATGQLRLRTAHPQGQARLPYRLMLDILDSIPFQDYSYYQLNSVHRTEGSQIYSDFLNRYTPLTATEVAMVEEVGAGVTGSGRAYASMTTNVNGDPIQAFAIMRHTAEAYEVGDTMSVRANLNTLVSPPFNFRSVAAQVNVTGPAGGNFVSMDQVAYTRWNNKAPGDKDFTTSGDKHLMLRSYGAKDGSRGTFGFEGKWNTGDKLIPEGYYVEISSNGLFVVDIWEAVHASSKLVAWRTVNDQNTTGALRSLVANFEGSKQTSQGRDTRADRGKDGDTPSRGRSRVRQNPVSKGRFGAGQKLGRGKYFFVQIHPKSRVEFKGKAKSRSTKTSALHQLGGTKVHDRTGFADALPGSIGEGYFIKTGMYKRTDTLEPWLVALPRSMFNTYTDSTKGGAKGLRTIKPFKANEEVKAAWKKFVRYYGQPVFASTKGESNLFRIHRDYKGSYYTELRKKPTKE